jgi:hypothetical protein
MWAMSAISNAPCFVGDGLECFEVDDARIRGGAADDELRPSLERLGAKRFHVDALVFLAHAVGHDLEEEAREVQGMPVAQVTAMRKIHPHDGVARLQAGHEHRHVGLGARVRLDVCVIAAEELLRPVAGEVLGHIGELAAAVVALPGIPLGVLVGENGAHRLEHRLRNKVLRGDHLELRALPTHLVLNGLGDIWIGLQ